MSADDAGANPGASPATRRVTVPAPAKLNLLLAVGSRRDDGFHEVVSVLQTLDLVDRLEVDLDLWDSEHVDVLVEADGVPGGDTLVTRAVHEVLRRSGVAARVWVTIEKEIPVGAGLGGGSSDAAAAMLAVNQLLGLPLASDELHEVAAGIGSDVPFFLLGPGTAAIATGRGEQLAELPAPTPRPWLLAFPNEHQPTARVYELHDPAAVPALPEDADRAVALALADRKRNDLEQAARRASPALDRLCGALADAGGDPLVCGSGATVAVPLHSSEDQRALEAVCAAAVPGCWTRVAWTTRRGRPDGAID